MRINFSLKNIVSTLLIAGAVVFGSQVSVKHTLVYAAQVGQVSVQAVQTDRPSPQPINGPIIVSTTANRNENVLYRFWIHDGSRWSVVQDYSKEKTYRWIPEKPGTYRIWVDGKAEDSKNDFDSFKEIVYTVNNVTAGITADKAAPQPSNSNMKLTAKSTGINNPLYRFWIHDGTSWKVVQDYSNLKEYNWIPAKSGNYRIWVDVKDPLSTKENDSFAEILYTIKDTAVINNVITDKKSPQPINNAININAEAAGSSNILYRFWIHDGARWSIVQDYSNRSSYKWIPGKVGTYRIWVDVKDANSRSENDSFKEIIYTVNNVTAGITVDKTAPQPSNSIIKLTANSTGTSNPLYRFWIHDGVSWSVVQDYSTLKEYNWTPSKSGNYRVWVDVRDALSTKENDSFKEILYTIKDNALINSITTDKISPQTVNSVVNIKAEAGGSKNILYRFWVHDGNSWSVVQDYSKLGSYRWVPSKAGNYRIWIDVKDENSPNDVDNWKEIYYNINTAAVSDLKADKVSPQPTGQTIKFTAKGSGSSDLLYRFWVLESTGWRIVQDYSSSNTYNWVPNNTGDYKIWVDVKNTSSIWDHDAYKEIAYSVEDIVVVNDIIINKQSPQIVNEAISFTAEASGSSNILYRYWIHDGSSWKVVQDFSREKAYRWTPAKAGIYRIWVDVKGANSTNEVDSWKEIYYEIKKFNTEGNTQDNIINLGFTAVEGDNLYYVSDEGTLKKKRFSTGTIEQVSGKDVMFINAINDKVYYRDNSDGALYEVNSDGTGTIKIASGNITYINVTGEWVYYCDNTSPGTILYRYHRINRQKEKVTDLTTSTPALNIVRDGEWLYFVEQNTLGMYKMKVDGTSKTRIGSDASGGFTKVGEWIYYINTTEGGKLYKIKADGSSRALVDSNKVIALNSKDGWVYYSTASKISDTVQDIKLYKVNSNGTAKTLVIDDVALIINAMDDHIYYINGQGRTCQIKLDGTGKTYIE